MSVPVVDQHRVVLLEVGHCLKVQVAASQDDCHEISHDEHLFCFALAVLLFGVVNLPDSQPRELLGIVCLLLVVLPLQPELEPFKQVYGAEFLACWPVLFAAAVDNDLGLLNGLLASAGVKEEPEASIFPTKLTEILKQPLPDSSQQLAHVQIRNLVQVRSIRSVGFQLRFQILPEQMLCLFE